jgi:N4-(beta-N-acetylglucosaminyl)-L-asparaginase
VESAYNIGMNDLHRRHFLAASGLAAIGWPALANARLAQPAAGKVGAQVGAAAWDQHRGPCVIASGNGLKCVERAMQLVREGKDCCEAVVEGVRINEDDPEDMTVGYGGLPNEEGIVELDASVMHGPTHKSGAVASVRGIKNVARLALTVLRRTDHCLIVGEGAVRFAKQHGFVEENLLTEKARLAWQKWKENLSRDDDWLGDDQIDRWKSDAKEKPRIGDKKAALIDVLHTTGTIHCGAVDKDGDIGSCTTTSGLSWKIPGRVGDSPIIGAGNYCDNDIGSAGCTGRGEAAVVTLAAHSMVMAMGEGLTPTQAALKVAKRIADKCVLERRNRDERGRPNFNVSLYALRKDGAFGAASLYPGGTFAVCDSAGPRVLECVPLFPEGMAK